MNYDGKHPEWKGRRVAFLPGHGTTLFIEGVSFEIVEEVTPLDYSVYSGPPLNDYLGDGEKVLTAPHGRDTINITGTRRHGRKDGKK